MIFFFGFCDKHDKSPIAIFAATGAKRSLPWKDAESFLGIHFMVLILISFAFFTI